MTDLSYVKQEKKILPKAIAFTESSSSLSFNLTNSQRVHSQSDLTMLKPQAIQPIKLSKPSDQFAKLRGSGLYLLSSLVSVPAYYYINLSHAIMWVVVSCLALTLKTLKEDDNRILANKTLKESQSPQEITLSTFRVQEVRKSDDKKDYAINIRLMANQRQPRRHSR
jgi:hypothetical protein